MPAHKVVSDQQMDRLLQFVEENKAFARDRRCTAPPTALEKQKMLRQWDELAVTLNSIVGATKTGAKWREYWNDRKYNAIRKAAERRRRLASDMAPKRIQLTATEKRILEIVSKLAIPVRMTIPVRVSELNNPPVKVRIPQCTNPVSVRVSASPSHNVPEMSAVPTASMSQALPPSPMFAEEEPDPSSDGERGDPLDGERGDPLDGERGDPLDGERGDPLDGERGDPLSPSSPSASEETKEKRVYRKSDYERARNPNLPPKWATDIESRRIAAQERQATALEGFNATMQKMFEYQKQMLETQKKTLAVQTETLNHIRRMEEFLLNLQSVDQD